MSSVWRVARVLCGAMCRAVQMLPLIIVTCLVLGCNYPAYACYDVTKPMYPTNVLVVFMLEALCLLSLVRCGFTDAGGVPGAWREETHARVWDGSAPYTQDSVQVHELKENRERRWCKTCNMYKPDRAHHCSICGRCVLRMDHHCVFISNCVGFRNHKYFLLFLLYVVLNAAWLTKMAAQDATYFGTGRHRGATTNVPLLQNVGCSVGTLVGAAICVSTSLVLFFFLLYHLYLVSINATTLEHDYCAVDWSLGSRWANFQQVFGTGPVWLWVLPTAPTQPLCAGQGDHFKAARQAVAEVA